MKNNWMTTTEKKSPLNHLSNLYLNKLFGIFGGKRWIYLSLYYDTQEGK